MIVNEKPKILNWKHIKTVRTQHGKIIHIYRDSEGKEHKVISHRN